mmetsp:Transcript_31076/g.88690  ORF Transcript_31076/g.88690 Transcript_31076/m.88690 type:complete len:202 (+) Transcript_31076:632-1237(+)
MQRAVREALHAAGVLDDLELAPRDRQEVDVADAEPRLLHDRAIRPRGIRLHGVVRPRIVADEVVHGLHGVEEQRCGHRCDGLVREPRHEPGAGQVLPAADQVQLPGVVLQACSNVLDGEGAVADNGDADAAQRVVVDLVEHAIADDATESLLAFVCVPPWHGEVAGVEHHGRGHEPVLDIRRSVGLLQGKLVHRVLLRPGD